MDKWEVYMEIKQLLKQGFSKAKVAKKLGVSRSTVYRYIKRNPREMAEWMDSIQTRRKKLDPYRDLILTWLRENPDMSAAQVFDWLIEKYSSLQVGESTVRSYVKELRKEYNIPKEANPRSYEAVPDCPMGEQMQVDFGQTRNKKYTGGTAKLYFIAFVLSHSRHKYKYWLDRPFTTKDVIKAHELAFEWFEGITKEIVYDQDNLLVVSENGGDLILTEEFQRYKEQRKLTLRVCRKADPESKGRIENVVGFIKNNFAKHRIFHNIDSWNEQGIAWLKRTGNAKVHNTTKKRPVEVFALEKQHLRPIVNKINVHPVKNSISRSIRKDNTIRYLSNRYSLPLGSFHKYSEVYLAPTEENELVIYNEDGEILAKHKISNEKGKLIQDTQHRRDRTKGIDDFIQAVSDQFEYQELAYSFLMNIREKYPRYIRDQLQMLQRAIQNKPAVIVNQALHECVKRKLYSATDFSDVIEYIKRHRSSHGTELEVNTEKLTCSLLTENWVLNTEAPKREMEQYYSILEGDDRNESA